VDPELEAVVDLMPKIDLADPTRARAEFAALIASFDFEVPGLDGLDIEDRLVPGRDGDPQVLVRVYRPTERTVPSPGVLWIHGGGFVIGDIETEHVGAAMTALGTGAVVVSVDYRLAPEHPFPAAPNDCFAALSWFAADASELGVDVDRIAVVGTSAGGGLAAAVALMARDLGGPALCFQLLCIPELDDRMETPSMQQFTETPTWNRPLALQSWKHYLGDSGAAVSPYAAPSRATDFRGLPPAYVSTAEFDPLRDEGILYALAMLQAGVSVELHQFPGTFHASDLITTAAISRRSREEVQTVLRHALGAD
jgi:acetyl esterase